MVEFGKEWPELSNAMMCVKDFEVNEHGRNDWYDGTRRKDDKLYAWIARDGRHLAFEVISGLIVTYREFKQKM